MLSFHLNIQLEKRAVKSMTIVALALAVGFAFPPFAGAQDFWEPIFDTPYGGWVLSIAINAKGHIFAGTFRDGLIRSTDNGDHWTKLNIGLLDTAFLSLAINSSGNIFAGTFRESTYRGGGLIRSLDNGDHWTQLNIGLPDTVVTVLAIKGNEHIFAGTRGRGLFRSSDNGDSWTQVNIAGLTNLTITSLAIDANGHIFAGTYGHGLFRSSDNGDSLMQVNIGQANLVVSSLAISPNGYIFAGTYYGTYQDATVYRSANNGNSWSRVNIGLMRLYNSVEDIAVNSISHIFAGTGEGVFQSTNNGDNWAQINTGLPANVTVYSLAISPNGYIFAGTVSSGIFRSVQSTTAVREATIYETHSSFALEQNYPNPFNPSTTFNFDLPQRLRTTLTIYDILGQKIAVLIDRIVETGHHTVKWDASAIPSGMYLYQLKAGSYRKVLKMALVK